MTLQQPAQDRRLVLRTLGDRKKPLRPPVRHRLAIDEQTGGSGGLQAAGVTLIPGEASFHDAHSLDILRPDGARDQLSADIIILATGSRPATLPFAEGKGVWTSTEALEVPGGVELIFTVVRRPLVGRLTIRGAEAVGYRKARELPGVKRILIASGLRYDIAVETPEYVKELVSHHVGGYLKIAPEHTEQGPLSKMMKPGMGTYDRFKAMFDKYSKEAGKEHYLIPYFIAAHPGTTDEDMLNLALWLKRNGFRADQVQNFYPSPMATGVDARTLTPSRENCWAQVAPSMTRIHRL